MFIFCLLGLGASLAYGGLILYKREYKGTRRQEECTSTLLSNQVHNSQTLHPPQKLGTHLTTHLHPNKVHNSHTSTLLKNQVHNSQTYIFPTNLEHTLQHTSIHFLNKVHNSSSSQTTHLVIFSEPSTPPPLTKLNTYSCTIL